MIDEHRQSVLDDLAVFSDYLGNDPIETAKDAYMADWIDVDELERRIEAALRNAA